MGYLKLERSLSTKQYQQMRKGIRQQCRERDWTLHEVKEAFGEPCWSSGSNPFYPWVLAYACDNIDEGWIFFDFWNEIKVTKDNHVLGKHGPEPLLRNIRVPAESFSKSFTFTPFGKGLIAKKAPEQIEEVRDDRG